MIRRRSLWCSAVTADAILDSADTVRVNADIDSEPNGTFAVTVMVTPGPGLEYYPEAAAAGSQCQLGPVAGDLVCSIASYLGESETYEISIPLRITDPSVTSFTPKLTVRSESVEATDLFIANNTASLTLTRRKLCLLAPAGTNLDVNGRPSSVNVTGSIANASPAANAIRIALGSVAASTISSNGGVSNSLGTITPQPTLGPTPKNPFPNVSVPVSLPDSTKQCLIAPNAAQCGGVALTNTGGVAEVPEGSYGSVTLNGNTNARLSPGRYGNITVNGSSTLLLSPGTYQIAGTITANGNSSITGNNVTLVFTCPGATCSSSVVVNGQSTLNLGAPTQGPYKSLVVIADPTKVTTATVSGSGTLNAKGWWVTPSATINLNGTLTFGVTGGVVAARMETSLAKVAIK